MTLTNDPHLAPKLKKENSHTLLLLCKCIASYRVKFYIAQTGEILLECLTCLLCRLIRSQICYEVPPCRRVDLTKFLRSILYHFSAPIRTLNNVIYQKNKNFIGTAVSTSTLTNPTLTSRNTSRITYQSRRPWFRSQESPCGAFV